MKKLFYSILLAAGFAAFTTSCNVQETRMPEETPEAALAGCPHERPDGCGASATFNSVDSDGSHVISTPGGSRTLGTVELDADGTNLNVYPTSGPDGLLVSAVDVYTGLISGVPLNGDGTVNAAAFPYHSTSTILGCGEDLVVPFPPGCTNLAVRVTYVELDFFGSVIGTYYGWIGGTRIGTDGWATQFCALGCITAGVSPECTTILPGYTPDCVTLTASVTSGTPGTLNYAWSTGATTSSITVCPTSTTTYSVTITSSGFVGSTSASASADVIVLSAPCGTGGNKIEICDHAPATPNTQCKSESFLFNYLDSHGGVAALAPGASRYTIGPCEAPQYPCD